MFDQRLDLLAEERRRELRAEATSGRRAARAEEVPFAPIGLRAMFWRLGRVLSTVGRRIERAAGPAAAARSPNDPTGTFV